MLPLWRANTRVSWTSKTLDFHSNSAHTPSSKVSKRKCHRRLHHKLTTNAFELAQRSLSHGSFFGAVIINSWTIWCINLTGKFVGVTLAGCRQDNYNKDAIKYVLKKNETWQYAWPSPYIETWCLRIALFRSRLWNCSKHSQKCRDFFSLRVSESSLKVRDPQKVRQPYRCWRKKRHSHHE